MTTAAARAEATARPWKVNKYGSIGGGEFGHGPVIAQVEPFYGADTTHGNHAANARLIVTAVNAFDDLVAALQAAREFIATELACSLRDACIIRDGAPDRSTMDELCKPYIEDCEARLAQVDAALAKAGVR